MSWGFGRFSRSSCGGAVSSSSMISLQRSMHSSQMYTPGPAISFLTWRWLFPQKLQRSCSLPSDARATSSPCTSDGAPRLPVGDHIVDDSVLLGLLGIHEVVALHVLGDLLHRLPGVVGDDLLEAPLEADDLARLDLDIGPLPLEAARNLVDQDLGVRQRHPLSFRAAAQEESPHRHRDPDADRRYVRLDELHRVVDREAGVDRSARRVDVDRDVLVGVLRLE